MTRPDEEALKNALKKNLQEIKDDLETHITKVISDVFPITLFQMLNETAEKINADRETLYSMLEQAQQHYMSMLSPIQAKLNALEETLTTVHQQEPQHHQEQINILQQQLQALKQEFHAQITSLEEHFTELQEQVTLLAQLFRQFKERSNVGDIQNQLADLTRMMATIQHATTIDRTNVQQHVALLEQNILQGPWRQYYISYIEDIIVKKLEEESKHVENSLKLIRGRHIKDDLDFEDLNQHLAQVANDLPNPTYTATARQLQTLIGLYKERIVHYEWLFSVKTDDEEAKHRYKTLIFELQDRLNKLLVSEQLHRQLQDIKEDIEQIKAMQSIIEKNIKDLQESILGGPWSRYFTTQVRRVSKEHQHSQLQAMWDPSTETQEMAPNVEFERSISRLKDLDRDKYSSINSIIEDQKVQLRGLELEFQRVKDDFHQKIKEQVATLSRHFQALQQLLESQRQAHPLIARALTLMDIIQRSRSPEDSIKAINDLIYLLNHELTLDKDLVHIAMSLQRIVLQDTYEFYQARLREIMSQNEEKKNRNATRIFLKEINRGDVLLMSIDAEEATRILLHHVDFHALNSRFLIPIRTNLKFIREHVKKHHGTAEHLRWQDENTLYDKIVVNHAANLQDVIWAQILNGCDRLARSITEMQEKPVTMDSLLPAIRALFDLVNNIADLRHQAEALLQDVSDRAKRENVNDFFYLTTTLIELIDQLHWKHVGEQMKHLKFQLGSLMTSERFQFVPLINAVYPSSTKWWSRLFVNQWDIEFLCARCLQPFKHKMTTQQPKKWVIIAVKILPFMLRLTSAAVASVADRIIDQFRIAHEVLEKHDFNMTFATLTAMQDALAHARYDNEPLYHYLKGLKAHPGQFDDFKELLKTIKQKIDEGKKSIDDMPSIQFDRSEDVIRWLIQRQRTLSLSKEDTEKLVLDYYRKARDEVEFEPNLGSWIHKNPEECQLSSIP